MTTWVEKQLTDVLIEIDRQQVLPAALRKQLEQAMQAAVSQRRFEHVAYDPEVDSLLTLVTQGDRSVGIWPCEVRVIFPMSQEQLKEDDSSVVFKTVMRDMFSNILDDRINLALWDWELAEMEAQADELERKQEEGK